MQEELGDDGIINALTSPLKVGTIKTREDGKLRIELVGELAKMQINPEDGTPITAWKTSSHLRNKLKGGQP